MQRAPLENDLLLSILKDFKIDSGSVDFVTKLRTIYSAFGIAALSSLNDFESGDLQEEQSIQNFKSRISSLLKAIKKAYSPEFDKVFCDEKEVCDYIYSTYLRNGFMYHLPHNVVASSRKREDVDNIALLRLCDFNFENMSVSGLGFYSFITQTKQAFIGANIFAVQEQPLKEYLEDIAQNLIWFDFDRTLECEFLNLNRKQYSKYWQKNPDEVELSLVKFSNGNISFYKYENSKLYQASIPRYLLTDFRSDKENFKDWLRIANALQLKYHKRPAIKAQVPNNVASQDELKKSILRIEIGYLLPPSEQNFFELYSWPSNFEFKNPKDESNEYEPNYDNNAFVRYMRYSVYKVFRQKLEKIGYSFEEIA